MTLSGPLLEDGQADAAWPQGRKTYTTGGLLTVSCLTLIMMWRLYKVMTNFNWIHEVLSLSGFSVPPGQFFPSPRWWGDALHRIQQCNDKTVQVNSPLCSAVPFACLDALIVWLGSSFLAVYFSFNTCQYLWFRGRCYNLILFTSSFWGHVPYFSLFVCPSHR